MLRAALAAALLLALAGPARAQPLEARRLGPAPAQLAARAELSRAAGGAVTVRWDPATGYPAVVRFAAPLPLEAAGPEAAAREALEQMAALFGGLAHDRQAGAREPRLYLASVLPFGAERCVRFEQRVGDLPLEGATLVVTLGRAGGRTVLRAIAGRAYRDAPPAFPLAGRAPAGATLVGTPRPSPGGERAWRLAWRTEERGDEPATVLTGLDGALLSRASSVRHAEGRVTARVFPRYRTSGAAVRPLRDLTVLGEAGLPLSTGERGEVPAAAATLPAGLTGPLERVLPWSGEPYPALRGGRLELAFEDGDPRATEVNVFHHLAEFRRFALTIPGLPREAVERQVVVQPSVDMFNAWARPIGVEVEGRHFDYELAFGHETGLDAAIVAHERSHALLFGLGVTTFEGDVGPLHEGYADYLAVLYTGDPELRFHGIGNSVRSLDEDRVYPEHWKGAEEHLASLVFSGALFDARRAAGADGPLVDAAALRAVPTTMAAGAPTVRDVARAILDGADAAVKEPLETHLRRHGLLGDEGRAPVIEAPAEVDLRVGDTRQVAVVAYDATLRALGRANEVLALVEAPGFVAQAREELPEGETSLEDVVALTFTPREGDVGRHLVTITAQGEGAERVAVRTIAVTVVAKDTPTRDHRSARRFRLRPGEQLRTPLAGLFDELTAAPSTAYRFTSSGRLSAGATLVKDELVLAPGADELGTHSLVFHAEPEGTDRDPGLRLTSLVTVIVGEEPAEIEVDRVQQQDGKPAVGVLLPPGEPVVVEAGREERLLAHGQRGGAACVANVSSAVVELRGGPAWVTQGGQVLNGTRPGRWTALEVTPPKDAGPGTYPVELALVRGGRTIATRTVLVVLIPLARAEQAPDAVVTADASSVGLAGVVTATVGDR